jgi:hypothetical protein
LLMHLACSEASAIRPGNGAKCTMQCKRVYVFTVRQSKVQYSHYNLTHANTVTKQYALDVLYIVRAADSKLTTTGTDDYT